MYRGCASGSGSNCGAFVAVANNAFSPAAWGNGADLVYQNRSGIVYGQHGGISNASFNCGAFCFYIRAASSINHWYVGAILSYKSILFYVLY